MDPVRWFPRTEAELREAVTSGALTERHHVDVKRVLDSGDKANRTLAIDLAALAVDSGAVQTTSATFAELVSEPQTVVDRCSAG